MTLFPSPCPGPIRTETAPRLQAAVFKGFVARLGRIGYPFLFSTYIITWSPEAFCPGSSHFMQSPHPRLARPVSLWLSTKTGLQCSILVGARPAVAAASVKSCSDETGAVRKHFSSKALHPPLHAVAAFQVFTGSVGRIEHS